MGTRTRRLDAGSRPHLHSSPRPAARLVGLNLLVTLRQAIGTLDNVRQILQVVGGINSATGFTEQSIVLNGLTDLLVEIFREQARCARMAFGAAEMPFNMAVEANMVVEVS